MLPTVATASEQGLDRCSRLDDLEPTSATIDATLTVDEFDLDHCKLAACTEHAVLEMVVAVIEEHCMGRLGRACTVDFHSSPCFGYTSAVD